jgi:GNAT superfamily N-acetyltransferase
MGNAVIRRAERRDADALFRLLTALAEFEGLEPPDRAARLRLSNDIFERKRLQVFLAEAGAKAVGYALYFYSYSSFLGRPTLYLEDIFVLKEYRGKGIGSALFRRCIREARVGGCGRMEWAVLTWNRKAIDFYEKAGARRLADWYVYRLDSDQFESVSGKRSSRVPG